MVLSKEQAEIIAIQALTFIAQDPDMMGRFLALSGVGPSSIRESMNDPEFLVGVLDYLLAFEPDLLAFADSANVEPEIPMAAIMALGGPIMD